MKLAYGKWYFAGEMRNGRVGFTFSLSLKSLYAHCYGWQASLTGPIPGERFDEGP